MKGKEEKKCYIIRHLPWLEATKRSASCFLLVKCADPVFSRAVSPNLENPTTPSAWCLSSTGYTGANAILSGRIQVQCWQEGSVNVVPKPKVALKSVILSLQNWSQLHYVCIS